MMLQVLYLVTKSISGGKKVIALLILTEVLSQLSKCRSSGLSSYRDRNMPVFLSFGGLKPCYTLYSGPVSNILF